MKFAFIPNSYKRVFRILLILAVVTFLVSVLIDGLLYDAAEHGDDRRIRLLLSLGANPNTTDGEFGVTALMAATQNGHLQTVDVLIRHGASVNAKDHDGNTALSDAESYQQVKIVEALKKAGSGSHLSK